MLAFDIIDKEIGTLHFHFVELEAKQQINGITIPLSIHTRTYVHMHVHSGDCF